MRYSAYIQILLVQERLLFKMFILEIMIYSIFLHPSVIVNPSDAHFLLVPLDLNRDLFRNQAGGGTGIFPPPPPLNTPMDPIPHPSIHPVISLASKF